MKNHPIIKGATIVLASFLMLVACGPKDGKEPNSESGSPKEEVGRQTPTTPKEDPSLFNWTISVKDTTTIAIGPIQSTTTLDVVAKNDVKGIPGHYSGTGSGKTVNTNPDYAAKSEAGVENTLQWDFVLDYPLASLTPDEKADEDGALAPLVPSDDDSLAPLVEPGKEADYEGVGTMTMAPRTAAIEGRGVSATKKLEGISFPINLYVMGEKVRLELKTPQGSVYFDGTMKKANP